jgi:serine/threonine protein kinase
MFSSHILAYFQHHRDINKIIDKKTILAELSVSAMLSSLARRAVCPNFITIRGVFSCPHPPAPTHWGTMTKKAPLGESFLPGQKYKPPRKPKQSHSGRYVYIRMELCNEGDAEDFLKRQPDEMVDTNLAQAITFQTAFALHAAADKFSVKHYDMKLLNIFLHAPETKRNLVLRYGLGSHTFAVNMPPDQAYIAKVADYGTANIRPESNGQPVTIAQFTTLENTPPDFMILGDMAKQGHAHDCFGLGLCMLHLFTGHAPYEEILEKVKCPPGFKKRLRNIWENENNNDYKIIRSVILTDVYKDEAGNVIDGEPDETLYDTLYRFLVLFGIPDVQFESKRCPKVWKAIHESFVLSPTQKLGKSARSAPSDKSVYRRHCNSFSVLNGSNKYIARARKSLESMNGGLDLLFKLCSFDPCTRATALEVLNSPFMANLAEDEDSTYHPDDTVYSYTSFSTHR